VAGPPGYGIDEVDINPYAIARKGSYDQAAAVFPHGRRPLCRVPRPSPSLHARPGVSGKAEAMITGCYPLITR